MSLTPSILLSGAAITRCLSNMKNLKGLNIIDKNQNKILTSVLVPLCVENDEVCLLYTLRSTKLARHSGQVSFPGGKQDNDETEIETAVRETEEEIGFSRDNIDVWGTMTALPGRDGTMLIRPVIGFLNNFNINALVPSEDEVAEVFTVSMATLCNTNNHAHMKWKVPLPIFECGSHKIWGITGMITHLFLQSFLPSDVYKPDFMRKQYTSDELRPSKL